MEQEWFVYIIYNKNCSYVGVTPDPEKRIQKHNGIISGGAKYTKSRGPFTLIYTEKCSDRVIASQREFQIKKMTRAQKLTLSNQQ